MAPRTSTSTRGTWEQFGPNVTETPETTPSQRSERADPALPLWNCEPSTQHPPLFKFQLLPLDDSDVTSDAPTDAKSAKREKKKKDDASDSDSSSASDISVCVDTGAFVSVAKSDVLKDAPG